MTFDDVVTSVTQDHIVPKVFDTVLGSNVLTMRLMGNAVPWKGETYKVTVKTSSSTAGGSYDGFDTFSTTRPNTRVQMSFNPKAYYQSVVLSNLEMAVNAKTREGVLDLLSVEMASAQDDMADGVGTAFYSDGTGNSSKDFTGLAAAVDDGSVAATYGGLARATYTTLQANVTSGVGALTLSGMATMYDSCTVGGDNPTLIVTTEAVWAFYEQLLQPTVRAGYDASGFAQVTKGGISASRGALKGEIGFDALWYRGTPVVKDEKCTAGYMYFLNEKYLKWVSLPHPIHSTTGRGGGMIDGYYEQEGLMPFTWTGLKEPVNQDAEIGQFLAYGDLVNHNPNRSGVLQGVTSV
jgi:hypothetical protein